MPDEKSNAGVIIQAFDRLGFKLLGGLARIFGSLAAKDEEVYWYSVSSAAGNGFIDLAAAIGATGLGTTNITQEADFVATRFMYAAVNPATGAFMPYQVAGGPSFTVLVTDGSTDRNIIQFPIHVETFAGDIKRSTPFTKNRLFRRNSTITFNLVNLQAVATRVFLAVAGYKVFDEASLDLVRRR
jgi:hypothetical protein